VTEAAIVATLQEILEELRSQRTSTTAQLEKIHDLVNSQLTEAVNRFKDALATIETLKAALAVKKTDEKKSSEADPAVAISEMLDATKTLALGLLEQTERMTALILDRRAKADYVDRIERRRIFP
jgi:hypothetical protein